MLDKCAPGYSRQQCLHNWQVSFNGRTYYRLPLGRHGKRDNPEIEIGHVKNMIRHFEIGDCAKRELPQLS